MRFGRLVVTLAAISGGLVAISGTAHAQCFAWACNGQDIRWSNPGALRRVQINTDDLMSSNSGLQWQINGAAKWSLATVNIGNLDIPIQVLDLFNDQNGILALRAFTNGHLETRQVRPLNDNAFKLGDTNARWTTVHAVNGTIQTSDGRQKTNVVNLSYGLNDVLKLRPVTFNWKAGPDSKTHIGLIAQEVEKVIPEVVSHGDNPSDPLGMSYTDFVPVLIKAIQTQQETIDKQSERIAKLEKSGRVASAIGTPQAVGASLAFLAIPAWGVAAFARRRRAAARNG